MSSQTSSSVSVVEKFNGKNEKAHSTILLSLLDEVLYEVADEETNTGVWKKLEKLYMTKSLMNKLLLKQRLFSLRMKEGSALKDHLDALNSILMDLKNVEVKIDDEDAALINLVSLPPSFENFMNSFVVGKNTITLEDVRSSLHSRELRHQASGTLESQPVGLSATGQDREEGHWKVNCPKLKEKGLVAAVAKDDSGSERGVVLSVVDYKEFDGGHVFMGNDSPCKVIGIGTIQIRMHDGVVRTLTDVHHVPDLKKNLILLGVLDSKGFKYTSENGVLRVSKGALVVMKATKEKSNSDLTKLWHMRLGHMSEKGMAANLEEERIDEKKRLDHLKQDQTMLVIKRFSERKKVFRERKKTGKIHAKRMVVKEIEDELLEEMEKFGWWFEQDIDGENKDHNENKLVMVNKEG
ncbi:hypothetical protein Tco_0271792 [Tanacetum coccineum]